MKLTFTTNPKAVELSNYLLGQAVRSLRQSPTTMKAYDLSVADLEKIDVFRKQFVKGLLKSVNK